MFQDIQTGFLKTDPSFIKLSFKDRVPETYNLILSINLSLEAAQLPITVTPTDI